MSEKRGKGARRESGLAKALAKAQDTQAEFQKELKGWLDDASARRKWITGGHDYVAWQNKLVIATVGLPARGKSYIAHKLVNFLCWSGIESEIFNAGKTRREVIGSKAEASFFETGQNEDMRENIAFMTLDRGLEYLIRGGEVIILDATNSTKSRRRELLARCNELSPQLNVLFVEVICNNEEILLNNMRVKIENSPDYKNWNFGAAMLDLKNRIENYAKRYETIESDSLSYIKLINLQAKVVCNRIYGNVSQLILSFLMNLHVYESPIYLCLTGSTLAPDHSTMLSFSKHGFFDSKTDSSPNTPRHISGSRLKRPIRSPVNNNDNKKDAFKPSGIASSDLSRSPLSEKKLTRPNDMTMPAITVTSPSAKKLVDSALSGTHGSLRARNARDPMFSSRPVVRTPKSLSSWLNGKDIRDQQILSESGKKFARTLSTFLQRRSKGWCERWNEDILPRYDAATKPPNISSPICSPRPRSATEPGSITSTMAASGNTNADGRKDNSKGSAGINGIRSGTPPPVGAAERSMLRSPLSKLPPPTITKKKDKGGSIFTPASFGLGRGDDAKSARTEKEPPPLKPGTPNSPPSSLLMGSGSNPFGKPHAEPTMTTKSRARLPDSEKMQIVVYTSGQPRAVATAREIPTNIIIHPALNSLNTGICMGYDYEEFQRTMPEELVQWRENPFTYRFPAGESQQDLVQKLQTLVMEFEGHVRPVVVISHISTLQVLYGYFLGHKFRPENYHTIRIPKNTVIELTPSHYGWRERRYDLSKFDESTTVFKGEVYDHNTNFYSTSQAQHDARAHD